jgi:HKD family nuclease
MLTNHKGFGGDFGDAIEKELEQSEHVEIASGYFSVNLLNKLTPTLLAIAQKGSCKLLFGMIYHERVTRNQKDCLTELNRKLKAISNESGVYVTTRCYHGKIFKFKKEGREKYYVGSSNFSSAGFKTNTEFNLEIRDPEDQTSIRNFLEFLFSERGGKRIGYPLDQISLELKKDANKKDQGARRRAKRRVPTLFEVKKDASKKDPEAKFLKDCEITREKFPKKNAIRSNEILLRPDDQPNSSLNLYFDAGRKSKRQGGPVYTPRPWHEIEITTRAQEQQKLGYPKGEWTAFVEDNGKFYKLDMITSGGKKSLKDIQSRGRQVLGELIKGKLERKGCLRKYERITSDILDEYGRKTILLKQLSDNEYILEF